MLRSYPDAAEHRCRRCVLPIVPWYAQDRPDSTAALLYGNLDSFINAA